MKKILIIGGGAAGMAAAVWAAEAGLQVHLFEQNEKLGKKLFLTGKGRCNFTNACEMEQLFAGIVTNQKFLYSAFYGFTNQQTIEWFEQLGVRTKVERGGRVFPVSDHSSDIIRALERRMKECGVRLHLNSRVASVEAADGSVIGVVLENRELIRGDAVIVATGGLSYASTGATGDGYRFAETLGHRLKPTRPALVPLETLEDYIPRLQGLSLRNVQLTIRDEKKTRFEQFGELLFTHYGISGPLALSASSLIGASLEREPLCASIDLKPALSMEQLDARLLREFDAAKNKQFKNIIPALVPAKLVPIMLELGGIPGDCPVHEIKKEARETFLRVLKHFPFTITGTGSYREAIITQGGVSVRDIYPATMESRLVKGLYFIGEVLDLDGITGGYNLQIAWSTARSAALAVAETVDEEEKE